MLYHAVVHYEGCYTFDIEANSKSEASRKAEQMFDDVDDRDIVANLADASVCDCWEITDKE